MEHDRKELIELIIYVLQHIGTGSPENFGSNGPPLHWGMVDPGTNMPLCNVV